MKTIRLSSGVGPRLPFAGTIALMLDANPNLSINEIKSILKETAKPLGLFHPNNTYGWGWVDTFAAVNAVIP